MLIAKFAHTLRLDGYLYVQTPSDIWSLPCLHTDAAQVV